MNKRNVAFLFVVGVLPLSMGCKQGQTHANDDIPTVDKFTRAKAAKLNVNDIRELHFTGPDFARFADNPIILKDKAEIDRYLTALRHAYCRPQGMADGIDILEIEFLPHKGEVIPSQMFFFNLHNELACFGPEFHRETLALQARIAQEDKN